MLLAMLTPTTIIIILAVAVLIFGVKRLPDMGRQLGKGIVEFKKGLAGIEDDLGHAGQPLPTQAAQAEAPRAPQPLPRAPEFHDSPKAS